MKEHPEIVPVHPKFYAYFVFVTFLKENCLQKFAVPLIQVIQNLSDKLSSVIRDHNVQGVRSGLDQPLGRSILQVFNPVGDTVLLHQNIVADRINQRTKAFGMTKTAFGPYQRERPGECLLFQVFNLFPVAQSRPQFQPNKLTEVADEMLFSRDIPCA
jgi:hypothetical protein